MTLYYASMKYNSVQVGEIDKQSALSNRTSFFTGFTDKKFDCFGVRLSYPLWNFMEKPLK